MTNPASNPYDGLIERLRNIARFRLANPDLAIEWRAAEALTRLTRDVEEAKEALERIAKPGVGAAFDWSDRECSDYWAGLVGGNRKIARATLTRLSRPELGADPAFVASQSSPSVSTKGFNRGERGEDK